MSAKALPRSYQRLLTVVGFGVIFCVFFCELSLFCINVLPGEPITQIIREINTDIDILLSKTRITSAVSCPSAL